MLTRLCALVPTSPDDETLIELPLIKLYPSEQSCLGSFAVVAWLRYIGTAILGCKDGKVYTDPACSGDSLPPENPLLQGQQYYFLPQTTLPHRYLPLWHKDTKVHISSTKEKRQPSVATRKCLLARDGMFCQMCGHDQSSSCNLVPACRGNPLFNDYIVLRGPTISPFDFKPRIPTSAIGVGIVGLLNLVQLCHSDHVSWDEQEFGLMPFPNVAFDVNRQPLPYDDAGTSPSSLVNSDKPPLKHPKEQTFPEHLHGSFQTFNPVIWNIQLDPEYRESQISGTVRLLGPLNYPTWWPPEFLWTYRFVSAVMVRWGETKFAAWSQTWTSPWRVLDERSSNALTSRTPSLHFSSKPSDCTTSSFGSLDSFTPHRGIKRSAPGQDEEEDDEVAHQRPKRPRSGYDQSKRSKRIQKWRLTSIPKLSLQRGL